ncbi:MAG: ribose-5-phosphate isomerase RpiA [Candidatus Undinarchaeales archaeon]
MGNEKLKERVGKKAAEFIKGGMTVGLGTGSTVFYLLKELEGKKIKGVCTSKDTEKKAEKFGIKTADLNDVEKIDIAVDGADEFDKDLNLIKGGGGALTREKNIDYRAEKFIVIVDESKKKEFLGDFGLPVEVMQFSWKHIKKDLEKLGARVKRRGGKKPFVTDNGNYILDAQFETILKPARLEKLINDIPGVVENGIFRKEKVSIVLMGTENGVEEFKKN